MSEWYNSQKKPTSNFSKLLQERIEKANPHHSLTAVESRRLNKLEAIADKLKRGENVQNRQIQTWISERTNTSKEVKRLCKEFSFTARMLKRTQAEG